MASSDSKADLGEDVDAEDSDDGEEPVELTPDEVFEMNSSAEEAFSPK